MNRKPSTTQSRKTVPWALTSDTSAYLITLAALAQGLSVTFFRSQRDAGLRNPMFSDEVSEPIFYRISNGRRAHFFNGTQSDRTSATAAMATKDKLKTKALLHAKNLNPPLGGLMSAQDHSLLGRMHQAGVKWFVIKPVAGSLGNGLAHIKGTTWVSMSAK